MNHSAGLSPGQWALGIGIIVLLLILRALFALVKNGLKQIEKDIIFVLVWRHFSGAHYHGERRTNATWWSHGTETSRKYDKDGFMSRWEHKPRGHRALWRLGVTAAILAAGYGLIFDWTVTLNAVRSFGVYLAFVSGCLIEMKVQLRLHNRHLVTPIVKSVAPVLKVSPHAMRRMVHISPENISDEGEIGYIELMPEQTPGPDQQATIARIVDAHLPVESEMEWKMLQSPKLGVIQAAQKPPPSVMWADMVEKMKACKDGEVFLGLAKGKQDYRASLTDEEDPHWGFDVNTKFGKSNFAGITVAQILHQDPQARAFIIDPKRSSLIDFVGSPLIADRPLLPGVMMANNPTRPEAMEGVISTARALLDKRSEEAELNRGKRFPCALVVIDELNQFADIMKDYWDDLKAGDKRLPKDQRQGLDGKWPGWADVMAILRMGRFVNMHVIAFSQDFRDDAFGGRGGRNYLGLKGMAGFNDTQWSKFIQTKPIPIMQNHSGRWIFSDGHDQTWVQVVFADAEHDRAAYDYASYGRELFVDELSGSGMSVPVSGSGDVLASSLETPTDIPAIDPPERAVITGLEPAAVYLSMEYDAFAQARTRYKRKHKTDGLPGEFRTGRQPSWYAGDLDDWKRSRPGSRD